MVRHALAPPATPGEWRAFHDIRRVELFEARGRFGVYDADHPDDRSPGNMPLLLTADGVAVGVVRLDDRGDGSGCVRLVAVTAAEQGRGHGRALGRLVEDLARSRGINLLYVNSAPEAEGYYAAMGWERFVWDREELCGIAADCVQMRKRL